MPRRRCWPIGLKRPNAPTCQIPAVVCISPRARRWIRIAIQYSLLGFVLLILIVWIGAEVESYHVKRADDTRAFYETERVCGLNATTHRSSPAAKTDTATVNIQTYATAKQANGLVVAHCGDCGHCSNPNDINIYDETKNSLLSKAAGCAKRGFVWGRKTTHSCMEQVGFTDECNDCWVDNIMCDLRYCLFTCIWQGLFDQVDNSETGLNKCTHCDEVRCGPDFVMCAGANRRRSGILSDIDRDMETEVCSEVTPPDWWKDPLIQQTWREQQENQQQAEDLATETTVEQKFKKDPVNRVRRKS